MSGLNKLGKLSLALLEGFVRRKVGDKFVDELQRDFHQHKSLVSALTRAEARFLSEYPDHELAKALFRDLDQKTFPPVVEAAKRFYEHPTDPGLVDTLARHLTVGLTISEHDAHQVAETYRDILAEELALVDATFRDNLSALATMRSEQVQRALLAVLQRVEAALSESSAPPSKSGPLFPTPAWRLVHPYPLPEHFTGREAERQMLSEWLGDDPDHPLFVLRALGGFGKSALVWYWLTRDVNPAAWPLVVWWSFYDRRDFGAFLREALTYLGVDIRRLPAPRAQADITHEFCKN